MQPDVCKSSRWKGSRNSSCSSCRLVLRSVLTKTVFYRRLCGCWPLMQVQVGSSYSQDGQAPSAAKGSLAVNHSGSDQLVSVVPGSKLSRGDAPLRFVENDVPTPFGHVQYTTLQGLAVANPHREAGLFTGF